MNTRIKAVIVAAESVRSEAKRTDIEVPIIFAAALAQLFRALDELSSVCACGGTHSVSPKGAPGGPRSRDRSVSRKRGDKGVCLNP